ncbi:hypothetical protein MSAN_01626800 [Mycena sanguinolenta]|uniref:Uncharacterized protein n=1 Tax=Mycena sanguinolenta TaxID=230812 RepID=A0A8H6XZU8_9AGAR|nr:hypothetical protein MSAN_01626800 [Mycena sanguinolenta]
MKSFSIISLLAFATYVVAQDPVGSGDGTQFIGGQMARPAAASSQSASSLAPTVTSPPSCRMFDTMTPFDFLGVVMRSIRDLLAQYKRDDVDKEDVNENVTCKRDAAPMGWYIVQERGGPLRGPPLRLRFSMLVIGRGRCEVVSVQSLLESCREGDIMPSMPAMWLPVGEWQCRGERAER